MILKLFAVFLVTENCFSMHAVQINNDELVEQSGPISELDSAIPKNNHQIGKNDQSIMKNLFENSKLFNVRPGTKKNKDPINQKFLFSRFKRGLEDNKLIKNKGVKLNGFPNRKHFCNLRRSGIELTYECKPFSLWNNELILDEGTQLNDTNQEIFSKKIKKFKEDKNYFEFDFPHEVTAVSNAVNRWKISSNVTILRLQYENIGSLKERPFYGLEKTLTILRLDSNLISFISESVFTGFHNVIELDLSRNRLSSNSLPRELFDSLPNLKILNLAYNQLVLVSDRTFACVRSLSYLDLSHNALIDLSEYAFERMTESPSLVINVRHNYLTQPRRGWLILPREPLFSSATCSQQIRSHQTPIKTESQPRMRILWGEHNPWDCSCNSSTAALLFSKTFILLRDFLNRGINKTCNDSEHCALAHQNLFPLRWSLDIPCYGSDQRSSLDLGSPMQSAKPIYDGCCPNVSNQEPIALHSQACHFLKKWTRTNFPESGQNQTDAAAEGLTNNQVTIIGIVIVVLCPVLLTLCPDCNKKTNSKEQNDSNHCCNPDHMKCENNRSNFSFIKRFSNSTRSNKDRTSAAQTLLVHPT